CRPEEQAVLESLNETTSRRALGAIFSAKESIFKALNPATGVFLAFQDAELESLPVAEGNEGPFTWRLHRSCGPALPVGFVGKGKLAFRGDCVLTAVWVERSREA
ncbi:MAG: 4'-phosphopantetheinyl transferase superfamily protein, partial [SAR324 cluster bacterium]|nr:4'-phosphopantetheinyl transferase superfamily protein [SAR324 cluster bacterium]